MLDSKILAGDEYLLRLSQDAHAAIPVDMELPAPDGWQPQPYESSLGGRFHVTGPATYRKGISSTLFFEPSARRGWWLERLDLQEQLPIRVSVRNVWTAQRNIVLRSGNPHNYVRMTEHIIAHRLGLGLDHVRISMDSGDPPLFEVGSMPIVDGIRKVGLVVNKERPVNFLTAKEPLSIVGPNGGFLSFYPAAPGEHKLSLDVAIDFPTAIGKQRVLFDVWDDAFIHGAHARTNCSQAVMLYMKTIGKFFADTRNLGYTKDNILVAGKRGYVNTPKLLHEGKSLEAVWHRACLDLLAALSLVDNGRLCGKIVSYKAGHTLDTRFMTLLHRHNALMRV
jgi:UDP-3-O-acyl-N-acetylglucosamine deacetylase